LKKGDVKIKDYQDGFVIINGVEYYKIEQDIEKQFCCVCGWGDMIHYHTYNGIEYTLCRRHGDDDHAAIELLMADRKRYAEFKKQKTLF